MMRRLLWAGAGAVLGVAGYRRASRLARAVRLGGRAAEPAVGPRAKDRPRGSRANGDQMMRWAYGASLFARDVRHGMELYLDRHHGLAGPNLGGPQARGRGTPGDPGEASGHQGVDYAKGGR